MSHDLLMLRGDVDGGWNLQVGEPVFLQKAMGNLSKHYLDPGDTRYPPFIGTPGLQNALYAYHGGQYDWFVATIGAKQALVAGLYALKEDDGRQSVHTPAPFWPSYPTLVRSAGLEHVSGQRRAQDITINTSPNNPDGTCPSDECDIWDGAYAHPVYSWRDGKTPWHRIAIFSGAKLFGLSGLRVGWLATNDEKLARLAAEYVEKATSGVSTLDQYALEGVIRQANKGKLWRRYREALGTLNANRDTYFCALRPYVENLGEERGMFAWFRAKKPTVFAEALAASGVKVIPGVACGASADMYRMSLGHEAGHTERAMNALRSALETRT